MSLLELTSGLGTEAGNSNTLVSCSPTGKHISLMWGNLVLVPVRSIIIIIIILLC
jgi:hypothetical protein